jgi:hypothetical protein
LQAWPDIDALKNVSGIGTYTYNLTLPNDWSSEKNGAKIGANAVNAIKAVGTTVGEVAGETIPVVGELVSLGLTLYDIFHTASGRPSMQAIAHPVYSAGI